MSHKGHPLSRDRSTQGGATPEGTLHPPPWPTGAPGPTSPGCGCLEAPRHPRGSSQSQQGAPRDAAFSAILSVSRAAARRGLGSPGWAHARAQRRPQLPAWQPKASRPRRGAGRLGARRAGLTTAVPWPAESEQRQRPLWQLRTPLARAASCHPHARATRQTRTRPLPPPRRRSARTSRLCPLRKGACAGRGSPCQGAAPTAQAEHLLSSGSPEFTQTTSRREEGRGRIQAFLK